MSEERKGPMPGPGTGEDPIGALLRVAGRRPTAPDRVAGRVFAATHEEWRRMVARRRRRVWAWSVAGSLAALVVLALWVGVLDPFAVEAPGAAENAVAVATVEVVVGETPRLVAAGGEDPPQGLATADRVLSGASIATGADGGVAVRLTEGGGSLRLGPSSTIRFLGGDEVELDRGVVYLDGGPHGTSRVAVHTDLGVIRERGTQFEVRILEGAVRVRVREGAVLVERDEPVLASAGLELRIDHRGDISRRTISASDESWSWVLGLAPSFRLAGRTLGDFLGWVERETGKRVEFASPEASDRLSSIVLYGSVDGLRPGEALDAVLPTCGLTAVEGADRIEVR